MTDEKDQHISLPIKEFVDREIEHLKQQVYTELDSRAKALDLARENSLREIDCSHHDSLEKTKNNAMILSGIISAVVSFLLSMVLAHFWK